MKKLKIVEKREKHSSPCDWNIISTEKVGVVLREIAVSTEWLRIGVSFLRTLMPHPHLRRAFVKAYKKLGYGKCYSMQEEFGDWKKMAEHNALYSNIPHIMTREMYKLLKLDKPTPLPKRPTLMRRAEELFTSFRSLSRTFDPK